MVNFEETSQQVIRNKLQLIKLLFYQRMPSHDVTSQIKEYLDEGHVTYCLTDSHIHRLLIECVAVIDFKCSSKHATLFRMTREFIISLLLKMYVHINVRFENNESLEISCYYCTTCENILKSICDVFNIAVENVDMLVLYTYNDDNETFIIDNNDYVLSCIPINLIELKELQEKQEFIQSNVNSTENIRISNDSHKLVCNKLFYFYIWYYPDIAKHLMNTFDHF